MEFVLFSRHASRVDLLLFDDRPNPIREIPLDPRTHRFGDLWRIFVPDVKAGQRYGFRVDGPVDPGYRFDSSLILLDPSARAICGLQPSAKGTQPPLRSVVVDEAFDWRGDAPPRRPLADTIVYETHLRGFTAHSSSGVNNPGTYLGFCEKIPYLVDLGITAVELLPIHAFNPWENHRTDPAGHPLTNYWGYSTLGFFAPAAHYSNSDDPTACVTEFKTLVRELHKAGIEVILDVVFNHTAEGNHEGPTLNFKGIGNSIFYHLERDKTRYKDFSGCGNSVNTNHPVVIDFIREALHYWVTQMHVDGFRFDLASVFCRDQQGAISALARLPEILAEDPLLRDVKLIAEPWDAAGAYHVGSFPGERWAEWNDKYRDEIRQFWRGDPGRIGSLATRFTGSSDVYQPSGRGPMHSINFVTCHDGFTLNDLVSYNDKHNLANGEENRDGTNQNYSFNYGVEGATDEPRIDWQRVRQIKNLLATLLLSQGVPMLLGGDEFRRTQRGNNNAYCQDNEISWFDWTLLERHSEIHRFARAIIWFRRRHPVFRRTDFFTGARIARQPICDINWYTHLNRPMDWKEHGHTLMCLISGRSHAMVDEFDDDILLLFNAGQLNVPFQLASGGDPERPWRIFFDTGNPSPRDVYPDEDGPYFRPGTVYPLLARSMSCFHRASHENGCGATLNVLQVAGGESAEMAS